MFSDSPWDYMSEEEKEQKRQQWAEEEKQKDLNYRKILGECYDEFMKWKQKEKFSKHHPVSFVAGYNAGFDYAKNLVKEKCLELTEGTYTLDCDYGTYLFNSGKHNIMNILNELLENDDSTQTSERSSD